MSDNSSSNVSEDKQEVIDDGDNEMAHIEAHDEFIYKAIPNLDDIIASINNEDHEIQQKGMQTLRKHLSGDTDYSCETILSDANTTKKIISFIEEEANSDLQYETAWVLTNMLSGHNGETEMLVNYGVIPPLINLLSSKKMGMQEQACWALANIMGECSSSRDEVLACGAVEPLLDLINSNPANNILDSISLIVVNLFRENNPSVDNEVAKAFLPHIKHFLQHEYHQLVPHALWALSYMAEDSESKIMLLLESDCLPVIIELLKSDDINVLIPALRTFVNIASGMCPIPQCIIDCGIMELIPSLLIHSDWKIKRQVVYLVIDFSNGPDRYLETMIEAGILQSINTIFLLDDIIIKREAFWIIPNFVINRKAELKSAIVENCLENFVNLCSSINDADILEYILLTIRELLHDARYTSIEELQIEEIKTKIEQCGGLKQLEKLHQSSNERLQKMSYEIVDHYFWGNEKKYESQGPLCQLADQGETVDVTSKVDPTTLISTLNISPTTATQEQP